MRQLALQRPVSSRRAAVKESPYCNQVPRAKVPTRARCRTLIASICDEDSITGLLLAGTGHINDSGKKNFITVDNSQSGSISGLLR